MNALIHLGFRVPGGEPVEIPLHHMVVSGLTQMSGKTTTLDALARRSGLRAVAFVTKPEESGFQDGWTPVEPYFREQCDWEYVQDLLEASLQERLKFERSWIIESCKGARSLGDVHRAVKRSLVKARGLSRSVYTNLDAYLEKVLPELAAIRFGRRLDIDHRTRSLMDLTGMRPETQALVIRSVIAEISARHAGVIVLLPEAWKFIPQHRGNPVKRAAEKLVREGAAAGNFLWLDSQDITGCDKAILKSIDVWLLGRQRERNEIRRILDQIPAAAKPRPEEVATLALGHFFACFGREVVRTYVQPAWGSALDARNAAITGVLPYRPKKKEAPMRAEDSETRELRSKIADLEKENARLRAGERPGAAEGPRLSAAAADGDLVATVIARLRSDPEVIALIQEKKQIVVKIQPVVVDASGDSMRGRLCRLILDGFLDEPRTGNALFNELKRRGARIAKPNVYTECKRLAEWGFLTIEPNGFSAAGDMKRQISEVA